MKVSAGTIGAGLCAAAVAFALAYMSVRADTAMTIGEVEVDSAVVDLYIRSRTQRPADQVTPEEREALLDELTDIYLLSQQPRTKELAADAEVQAQLELQKRALLAQLAANDFLERNGATEEEILAEYNQQTQSAPPQQYKARHILVETQSAAQDLIAELDGGADFAELARSNSTGPSGPSGGDLGWFSPNQMVAPFSAAVEALGDGEYTKDPVQTQFGWHVILREESRDQEPPPLDGVRDVIEQRIKQRKLQEYLDQLREL